MSYSTCICVRVFVLFPQLRDYKLRNGQFKEHRAQFRKKKKVSIELGKPHQALSLRAAPRPQPELLVALLLGSAASAECGQAESSEPPTMAFTLSIEAGFPSHPHLSDMDSFSRQVL